MISVPPKIDLLPEHLIDQIKAGEVIERPGSLIKEILENAVDAGSTRLELTLKNNGLDLISLKDNGHGMSFQDLPLAFHRHATSKITRFEDLYRLNSFGFRGEALASIASISRLQCSSFNRKESEGAEIRFEGGQTIYHGKRMKSGFEHGTELVIRDLFFNTPARLKFIQSQTAEKTFIKKIVYAFIGSHPEIEFHLKIDDEEKEIIPAHQDLKERLLYLSPKGKGLLLTSERFYENNEVTVYLLPASIKAPSKWQNIYINDRFILDKQLHRVMTNAIQASFGEEDFHYLAFFYLPVDSIDVNVHPNKTVIKCMEASKMISLLTSTVKEMAQRTPLKNESLSGSQPASNDFFQQMEPGQNSLLQERHHYNMEGFFSPHQLPEQGRDDLLWMGSFFLKKTIQGWLAVHSGRLLHQYVMEKLKTPSSVTPLLVSEPYSAKNISKEKILKLSEAGFEIDYLNPETLVLRSIPDWFNGFPLHEIVQKLLTNSSLSDLIINKDDWARSLWEEMLSSLTESDLRTYKISFPLESILQEKFK